MSMKQLIRDYDLKTTVTFADDDEQHQKHEEVEAYVEGREYKGEAPLKPSALSRQPSLSRPVASRVGVQKIEEEIKAIDLSSLKLIAFARCIVKLGIDGGGGGGVGGGGREIQNAFVVQELQNISVGFVERAKQGETLESEIEQLRELAKLLYNTAIFARAKGNSPIVSISAVANHVQDERNTLARSFFVFGDVISEDIIVDNRNALLKWIRATILDIEYHRLEGMVEERRNREHEEAKRKGMEDEALAGVTKKSAIYEELVMFEDDDEFGARLNRNRSSILAPINVDPGASAKEETQSEVEEEMDLEDYLFVKNEEPEDEDDAFASTMSIAARRGQPTGSVALEDEQQPLSLVSPATLSNTTTSTNAPPTSTFILIAMPKADGDALSVETSIEQEASEEDAVYEDAAVLPQQEESHPQTSPLRVRPPLVIIGKDGDVLHPSPGKTDEEALVEKDVNMIEAAKTQDPVAPADRSLTDEVSRGGGGGGENTLLGVNASSPPARPPVLEEASSNEQKPTQNLQLAFELLSNAGNVVKEKASEREAVLRSMFGVLMEPNDLAWLEEEEVLMLAGHLKPAIGNRFKRAMQPVPSPLERPRGKDFEFAYAILADYKNKSLVTEEEAKVVIEEEIGLTLENSAELQESLDGDAKLITQLAALLAVVPARNFKRACGV